MIYAQNGATDAELRCAEQGHMDLGIGDLEENSTSRIRVDPGTQNEAVVDLAGSGRRRGAGTGRRRRPATRWWRWAAEQAGGGGATGRRGRRARGGPTRASRAGAAAAGACHVSHADWHGRGGGICPARTGRVRRADGAGLGFGGEWNREFLGGVYI